MAVSTIPVPASPAQLEGEVYLRRLRDLVFETSGIFHPDAKLYYMRDRCQRRMGATRIATLDEYYYVLTHGPDREAELRELLNEVSVGETCFFRNQPQLETLTRQVLPRIVEAKSRIGFRHLRLWSAGCATGEEAYSIAMVLQEEAAGQLAGWTFEIIATDLNERSLAVAREGVYGDYTLRNVPLYFRQKYLRREGSRFRVADSLRPLVQFARLNLLDDSRMLFMKGMDVIFCCNVLIYFGAQPKRRAIQHFYGNLLPGGSLFLGHAESLFGINDDFKMVQYPHTTGYRRPGRESIEAGEPA